MAASDQTAAEILAAAGAVCARCETKRRALAAVERGGVLAAECLNRAACDRRIRRQLREEAER